MSDDRIKYEQAELLRAQREELEARAIERRANARKTTIMWAVIAAGMALAVGFCLLLLITAARNPW